MNHLTIPVAWQQNDLPEIYGLIGELAACAVRLAKMDYETTVVQVTVEDGQQDGFCMYHLRGETGDGQERGG